ncbi:MAG: hypothetical protein ACR2L2_20800 [Acidobacteriota bacterium]
MTHAPAGNAERLSTLQLVAIPALVSLAVTLLRLAGERAHWSAQWFSRDTTGIFPTATNWLVGITWLAFPFGIYFAVRLIRAGAPPHSPSRAVLWALSGVASALLGLLFVVPKVPLSFPTILLAVWTVMIIAAAAQRRVWPELFRTLFVYGLASRIPVVVVMFLAMRGAWGTHYDYVGVNFPVPMTLTERFLWLAFFPQLIFWVGFTILLGSLSGSLTALWLSRRDGIAVPGKGRPL